ncbi:MAG: redox-regulated ATPase YchF [Bacteroidetes bacterium HGW-Bacteroidetes-22]|nr:MAG: redox-regulated ATPase YchF [Bacteroidetes bacterium HGW-Bacteroidetes-22]
MALTCGIVGLTNSGKTTIFNCISNSKAQASSFTVAQKSNIGMISVPDDRLYKIDALIKSVRVVHTTVDIVDIPGLTKGGSKGEGNKFLTDIRNVDALIYVLRCFEDAQLPHIEGSIDPIRDKELVDFELQVKDIESVEKKIGRMEKAAKTGDKDAKHGLEVLAVYKDHLENLKPARTAPVVNDDKRFIEDIFLLTMKPVMYVCNVDDNSALNGNRYSEKVRESLAGEGTEILVIAGKLEAEIAELEDAEDRKVFLEDVGLAEPGVNKMIREAYSLLDLQTFFTAGPKEVRAWTIHRGMTAPQAAGVIHSDLERGFIRAEVIKYDDFMKYGTELACKEAGKLSVEGKNYVVGDGDLLHIRFNV